MRLAFFANREIRLLKTLASLLFALSLTTSAFAARHPRLVRPPVTQPESSYLRSAKETGAYLLSISIASGDTLSWSNSDIDSYRHPGIDNGAAGIGFFFLRLYQVTGETKYLDAAKGAANFVAASYARGEYSDHDWLAGAAGGGEYLLAMWQNTRDTRYRDAALATASWLRSHAIASGPGLYWQHTTVTKTYTGIAHGAAGVGLFFLDLFDEFHDPADLDVAKRAAAWSNQYVMPVGGDGKGLKRLVGDSYAYNGWCGGSSGWIFFLGRLAKVDPTWRDALISTANGLLNDAVASNGGDVLSWTYDSTKSSGLPIIYCHGTASSTAALAYAYSVTGDARYLGAARKGNRWMEQVAIHESTGLSWTHIDRQPIHETGYLTGTASVGHAFLRFYRVENDESALSEAKQAADYLLSIADHPASGQSRWINFTAAPADFGPPAYENGWYTGTAGVGMFLLELDATIRHSAMSNEFSAVNP